MIRLTNRTLLRSLFVLSAAASLLMSADANASGSPTATVGLNFTGTSRSESGFRPPDTMGTVGPDHIVEMVNGRYKVFSKTTGSVLETRSLNSFWSTYGQGYNGSFSFDPRVQYDPSRQRFYASSVDNAAGVNNILVAVSKTNNPLDGWTGFKVDADTDNAQWADFPQMGFTQNELVISNNMFGISGGSFDINMLVVPLDDLTGLTPTVANATLLENQYSNTGFGSAWQPVIDLDNSTRNPRLFSNSSTSTSIRAIELTGGPSSPAVNNIADLTGLPSVGNPPLAKQPGTQTFELDSGGDRLRSAVTLQNGAYYGVSGIGQDGRAALRWWKIDADTMALDDFGVIADPDKDLIYGSIAVNEFDDIVIGFTGTSETEFPSAYAVVGETDDLGDITFGDLILLKAGVAEYDTDSSGRNRWGDYSSVVIDPSDPNTFWTFQEWASSTNNWSTQITQLTVPEPSTFALMALGGLYVLRRRRP